MASRGKPYASMEVIAIAMLPSSLHQPSALRTRNKADFIARGSRIAALAPPVYAGANGEGEHGWMADRAGDGRCALGVRVSTLQRAGLDRGHRRRPARFQL